MNQMKKIILTAVVLMSVLLTQAQEAPTTGFLLPRHTTAERDALVNPAKGITIFNTTTNTQQINTGTGAAPVWSTVSVGAASSKWTNDATNTRVALTNLSDGTTARPAGTEFVVTDDGKLVLGRLTPLQNRAFTIAPDNITTNAALDMVTKTNSASGTYIQLRKSRNNLAVNSGDELGYIDFHGFADQSRRAALIISTAGTPGVNYVPGNLSFYTTNSSGVFGERMSITSQEGYIGIGTSTPSNPFTIQKSGQSSNFNASAGFALKTGTASQQIVMGYDESNNYGFISSTNGAGTSIVINKLGGNVGIGTATPTEKLDVTGSIGLSRNGYNNFIPSVNDITTPKGLIYLTSSGGSYPFNGSGNIIIQPWSGTLSGQEKDVVFVNGSTNTITMVVNKENKVGIGTTEPKTKLHVVGLPVYADNATAKAAMGGAAAVGAFFHTGDGVVRVVF